jgi:multimeric flavodoxin WrbA
LTITGDYRYNRGALQLLRHRAKEEGTMKAVILFGSPRKNGNTIQLARVAADTLKEKGHSVRMLYLNDLNIRPCQGCYICRDKGVCRINDDMKDIRKYVLESDLIIYATPIYWFGPSGQLKLAMDRSIAFLDKDYVSRVAGKKAITLMTCGDTDIDTCRPALDMFKKTFDLLKLDHVGNVAATGCEAKGDIREEFKEKARQIIESIV